MGRRPGFRPTDINPGVAGSLSSTALQHNAAGDRRAALTLVSYPQRRTSRNQGLLRRRAGWPVGDIPTTTFSSAFEEGPQTTTIDRAIAQANIVLGHGGVSREPPDFYALSVLNYILGGGGFASRLVEETRAKRGLAYGVTPQPWRREQHDALQISERWHTVLPRTVGPCCLAPGPWPPCHRARQWV